MLRLLVLSLALAAPDPAAPPTSPQPVAAGPAAIRVSYWTTRPGKGAEAHAFWKPFAGVFEEMKQAGVIDDWLFFEPAVHTGEDWDLGYLWICRDLAAFGRADDDFNRRVAAMDASAISGGFDAAFDGTKHRDEIWRGGGTGPGKGVIHVGYRDEAPPAGALEAVNGAGLVKSLRLVEPAYRTGQDWGTAVILTCADLEACGKAQELLLGGPRAGARRDALWRTVDMK